MPNRIVVLDENTANRIAAGEVIERPASAVKELVENSIDAGATRIDVRLEEGGKRLIEVVDNGCGMSPEDAVLSLQRHATSKMRTAEDLFAIRTLGFRGEALPSIASVSHLTLTTKDPALSSGARVVVHGGDIERIEEVGARDGTQIVVEDLFANTPARLKFMKSAPTEMARAVTVVGNLAIAHAEIGFTVSHGGKELLSTPGRGDPLGAVAAVWGREIARHLVPVHREEPGLTVSGYVAAPDLTRAGRSHELFFVNGRVVRSPLIGHALEEAFRALTPESRYPIGILFIDIAPDLVDVNVHPTKNEVKFTRDGDVHHAVHLAVKDALLAHGMIPVLGSPASPAPSRPSAPGAAPPGRFEVSRTLPGPEFEALARASVEAFRPVAPAIADYRAPDEGEPLQDEAGQTPLAARRPFAEQLRGFRVLGQLRNTYIIAETDEGLAFVDQHTAHERVLFERLTEKRSAEGIVAQRLAVPLTLALGAAEAALLAHRLEDFAVAGWEIEPFGRDSFLVRAMPALVGRRNPEALLRDMIDELVHQSVARRLLVQRDHVTITHACKMAVKAGDPLEMEEMVGLLEQLAETENPYLCPHGRPVVVTMPIPEIERRFKR